MRVMASDQEHHTAMGLTFVKNRELEGNKTTYRSIEIKNDGSLMLDHPFLDLLFQHYHGSILKIYKDKEDWKDSLKDPGIQVLLIPELAGDKFFQDRWDRVIRFAEKHVLTA